MILAVYNDGELADISKRSLDLTKDGVYEVYLETDEITVTKSDSQVKLILINNFKDLFPYVYK